MTPGGPGALTTVELLEESAAAWNLLAYQAQASNDTPVVVEGRRAMAVELRARAERLRRELAHLENMALTDYGRGELVALRLVNAPAPPSHTCPDKPDEPCPACTPAPTGTTRGRDE